MVAAGVLDAADEDAVLRIVRAMAALTELRGALGGGLAAMAWHFE